MTLGQLVFVTAEQRSKELMKYCEKRAPKPKINLIDELQEQIFEKFNKNHEN